MSDGFRIVKWQVETAAVGMTKWLAHPPLFDSKEAAERYAAGLQWRFNTVHRWRVVQAGEVSE